MKDNATNLKERILTTFSLAQTPGTRTARKDYWKGFIAAKREDGAITHEEYSELFTVIQKGEC